MVDALHKFTKSHDDACLIALRSAYRIAVDDSILLSDKFLVVFDWIYDPRKVSSNRITLGGVRLHPRSGEMIAGAEHILQSSLRLKAAASRGDPTFLYTVPVPVMDRVNLPTDHPGFSEDSVRCEFTSRSIGRPNPMSLYWPPRSVRRGMGGGF